MTLTRKGTRAEATAAIVEEFLQYDYKIIANSKEVQEDDATSDSKKRERDIADWIGRPRKPPLSNEDDEYEGKEEHVGATKASTEDNSPIDEYEEGREYNREDDRKETVILDAKKTEEEASLRHEGKLPSSDLSERSYDNNDDDDGTGSKENNCYGDGDGGGDRNTGAEGGSTE